MWTSMDDLPDVTWVGQFQVAVVVHGLEEIRSCRELLLSDSKVPPRLSVVPPTKPSAE